MKEPAPGPGDPLRAACGSEDVWPCGTIVPLLAISFDQFTRFATALSESLSRRSF